MKREIFSRGVRMQHQFGDTEKVNDPIQHHTFELPTPDLSHLTHCSPPVESQQYGESRYRDAPSPIQKPSGAMADFSGPSLDTAEVFARPFPVGTKRRLGPLKTDK